MKANIHPVSGIAYGVINANSLDSEVLDAISFGSGIDRDYIIIQAEWAKEHGFEIPVVQEGDSEYQYWKRVQQALNEFDADWETFEEEYQEFTGNIWLAVYDGVSTLYNTDSNTVMVFESSTIVKVNKCSPCYPNAGDLDTPNEEGIDAYGVPVDWLNQY